LEKEFKGRKQRVCGLRGLGHGGNECAIKLLSESVKLGISLCVTVSLTQLLFRGPLVLSVFTR